MGVACSSLCAAGAVPQAGSLVSSRLVPATLLSQRFDVDVVVAPFHTHVDGDPCSGRDMMEGGSLRTRPVRELRLLQAPSRVHPKSSQACRPHPNLRHLGLLASVPLSGFWLATHRPKPRPRPPRRSRPGQLVLKCRCAPISTTGLATERIPGGLTCPSLVSIGARAVQQQPGHLGASPLPCAASMLIGWQNSGTD